MTRHFTPLRILCMGALLSLSACATIGEKEFSCPGRPKGVSCLSATQVYMATETTDAVVPTIKQRQSFDPAPELVRTSVALPTVDKPIPIRTPAQVMRVWTAPWEDTHGVLHAGGYHFIEVQSRRWNFGETGGEAEPVRVFSIQKATLETKKSDTGAATATKTSSVSARPAQTTLNDRRKPSPVPSSTLGASK